MTSYLGKGPVPRQTLLLLACRLSRQGACRPAQRQAVRPGAQQRLSVARQDCMPHLCALHQLLAYRWALVGARVKIPCTYASIAAGAASSGHGVVAAATVHDCASRLTVHKITRQGLRNSIPAGR